MLDELNGTGKFQFYVNLKSADITRYMHWRVVGVNSGFFCVCWMLACLCCVYVPSSYNYVYYWMAQIQAIHIYHKIGNFIKSVPLSRSLSSSPAIATGKHFWHRFYRLSPFTQRARARVCVRLWVIRFWWLTAYKCVTLFQMLDGGTLVGLLIGLQLVYASSINSRAAFYVSVFFFFFAWFCVAG